MDYTEIVKFALENKPFIHATLEDTKPETAVESRKCIETVIEKYYNKWNIFGKIVHWWKTPHLLSYSRLYLSNNSIKEERYYEKKIYCSGYDNDNGYGAFSMW